VPEATPPRPLMSDIWSTQGSTVSAGLPFIGAGAQPPICRPISLSHFPPPPIFSTPPRAFTQASMSTETPPLNNFMESFVPSVSHHQPVQSQSIPGTRSMSPCSSMDQKKAEIQNLLSDFQRNLDDILTKTFGPQPIPITHPSSTLPLTPPNPPFWLPPIICASCARNVATLRQFTCENCCIIMASQMLLSLCLVTDRLLNSVSIVICLENLVFVHLLWALTSYRKRRRI